MRSIGLDSLQTACVAFLSLLATVSPISAQTSSSSWAAESGIIIRAPDADETFRPNKQWPFNPMATTSLVKVEPSVLLDGKPQSKVYRLPPGRYLASMDCNTFAGEGRMEAEVFATEIGHEYLVECVVIGRGYGRGMVMKQPIMSGDRKAEVTEARKLVLGAWNLKMKFDNRTEEASLLIFESKGRIGGKLKSKPKEPNRRKEWGADIRINAQRRGVWFESKWMVEGEFHRTQFVAEYKDGELIGEAAFDGLRDAQWTATKE